MTEPTTQIWLEKTSQNPRLIDYFSSIFFSILEVQREEKQNQIQDEGIFF